MSLYEDQQHFENDIFKQTEKAIKLFCKSRRVNTPIQTNLDFTWSDVFDHENCSLDMYEDVNNGIFDTKCLKIHGFPEGFYFVPGALSIQAQLDWAQKSLESYSEADHTNLSNLKILQTDNNILSGVVSKTTPLDSCWAGSNSSNNFRTFLKLRWSCLGYHYDWTARMYKKNLKSVFPEELSMECKRIVRNVKNTNLDLDPEAAIVNYYPLSSSMGGHLDDAEHTMEKPIVSISLGCSAIFLLGGKDRTIKPIPILLRSGDALVMSGESRYCYHGVPVILPPDFDPHHDAASTARKYKYQKMEKAENTSPPKHKLTHVNELYKHIDSTDVEMKKVVDFLNVARININVRQVRVDTSDDSVWTDKAGTGSQRSKDV